MFDFFLGDENKKLSFDELINVVYQLKFYCSQEYYSESNKENANNYKLAFYDGEIYAFNNVLDLLVHLDKGDSDANNN